MNKMKKWALKFSIVLRASHTELIQVMKMPVKMQIFGENVSQKKIMDFWW